MDIKYIFQVGFDLRRVHLTDRKDIGNIKQSFRIASIERHSNDQQSVLSWIHEWAQREDNPILFYNLQG